MSVRVYYKIFLTKDQRFWHLNLLKLHQSEAGLEGGAGGEGLQTVLIKVKLIIINAPLTYVYLNTIKTYLTPNHLLFGRQLLCYSNTTSAVIRNLTVLWSTTDKINRFSNHFWHRWRHEYVVNLCETQWASKVTIKSQKTVLC